MNDKQKDALAPQRVIAHNTLTGEEREYTTDDLRRLAAEALHEGNIKTATEINDALKTLGGGVAPRHMPDFRNDLANDWKPGNLFFKMMQYGMINSKKAVHPLHTMNFAMGEERGLRDAALYWVSADMANLITGSMNSIPDDIFADELQVPAPAGLIYFEVPIIGTESVSLPWRASIDPEVLNQRVHVQAIAWSMGVLGPIPERPQDTPALCISSYQFSERYLFDIAATRGHGWIPLGKSDWPLADPLGVMPFPMDEQATASFVEDRKFLAALFTLLHQEGISETTTEFASRPVRRRTERAGIKASSDVLIVRLRRTQHTKPDGTQPSAVEWKNRWMVSGHWRWQPFGPGRKERKLIFIPPYIKGPEDKELKLKEKVNVWVR